jgi:hypothetical protein
VALALLPFLLPYSRVRAEQGLVRTIDDVRIYSAGWTDYLATAGRIHYAWWSHRFFGASTALFPGALGTLLALVTVARGVAWTDRRARMALAFGVVGFALSFGASLPGYEWLQTHIPLFQGIRAAARWGLLFLIAIAILAGYGVAILEARLRKHVWWPALAVALIGIVTLEALRAPLPMERYEGIPAVHSKIAREEVRAIVVFPLYGGGNFNLNADYMLHQTRHWKPMLNAYSSFAPASFHAIAQRLQSFPDQTAIQELRAHGFTHVVLHRAPLEHDYGAAAVEALRTHPDLEFVFEEDGVVLYRGRGARHQAAHTAISNHLKPQSRKGLLAVEAPVILSRAENPLHVVLRFLIGDVVDPLILRQARRVLIPATHAMFAGVVTGQRVVIPAEFLHHVAEVARA